jgi:peptidoglycan hydrolase-like protein with peptidoglycan-binding domain
MSSAVSDAASAAVDPEGAVEMADRVTTINERTPVPDESPTYVPQKRLWPWLVTLVVLLAIAAVTGWALFGGSESGDADAATTEPLEFAEVIRTDLEEVSTYEATLGSIEGDPVQSQLAGTITANTDAGETVASGDVLYEVDGEPVALLHGAIPAYRTMTAIEETSAITAGAGGTITGVPVEGTLVQQGDVLYEVDGEPVVLLTGDVPFYRPLFDARTNLTGDDIAQLEQALTDLGFNDGDATVDDEYTAATADVVEAFEEAYGIDANGRIDAGEIVFLPGPVEIVSVDVAVGDGVTPGRVVLTVADLVAGGTEGPDVLQLEQALADLGYAAAGAMTVDGLFTVETRAAVREFQAAIGAEDDGVVDLGEVVFRPDSIFVSEQLLEPGSPVNRGSAVLAVASAEKLVTLDLPASDQQELSVGQAVTVELPNRTTVPATVASIASVATRGQDGATFEVLITLDDSSAAAGLDEAPVDVDVVSDSRSQVVAIPVTALIALREGGYAVEVQQADGTTRLVGGGRATRRPGFGSLGAEPPQGVSVHATSRRSRWCDIRDRQGRAGCGRRPIRIREDDAAPHHGDAR